MRSALVLCIVALFAVPVSSTADIAPYMSFQGVLRDGTGNVVPDGSYLVTFRIYDVATGGTALWTENQTMSTVGGIFNAYLGSVAPLDTLAFDVPYWLGISVEADAELDPRTELASVPYAAHAGYADICTEGDSDWEIDGDNIHHQTGMVSIGHSVPTAALDVVSSSGIAGEFYNNGTGMDFTLLGVNNTGTAGAFFSGEMPGSYPGVPAAVYGRGGPSSRGAHFSSDGDVGVFATCASGRAVHGYSTGGYAGYFSGGGLGVYVDDLLETNEFKMPTGSASGYVLTSDAGGIGTWQPAEAVSDGDWNVGSGYIYSNPSDNVGIGVTYPMAKFDVSGGQPDDPVMWVRYNGTGAGRMVAFSRSTLPSAGNDLFELKVPENAPYNCQLIEAQRGVNVVFAVDGDGWFISEGGARINGQVFVDSTLTVTSSEAITGTFETSNTSTSARAVTGTITGTGSGTDPVGVSGESVPSDGWGVGGSFKGGYTGVRGHVYPTGGQTYSGVYGIVSGGTGDNYGVYGYAINGDVNYGVYGSASGGTTDYAGFFAGDVEVTGTLYGGSKAFKIDHPLDPENKYLVHTSVESDEMVNVYTGNVTLDSRGEAVVELPEWLEAVNRDFRYQLTAIGAPGPDLYVAEKIRGNSFRIAGGVPGSEVSWQVTGVRQDPYSEANRSVVEVRKPSAEVGKYMHPEAYGMPRSAGVGYVGVREIQSVTPQAQPLAPRDRSDGD